MGVYKRGRLWWISYAGPTGELVRESTEQTDQRVADRMYRAKKREVALGTWSPGARREALTVEAYADRWVAARHEAKVRTARDEEVRLRTYVLPRIGKKPLDAVRRPDVVQLVREVGAAISDATGATLAPRTVHHVYGALRAMYGDALGEELVLATPCTLRVRKGELPKKRDADPTWRARAIFTRDELERIISADPSAVPDDRRTLYAIELLCGFRFGEAAGRRWRDLDSAAQPLGSLQVATQYVDQPLKTENPRAIPVHPVLAAILAEWRLVGFPRMFGRAPKPDDWIVPSREGRCRSVRHGHRKMQEDLARIGLRPRRQHDTRRTFITLARCDGAPDPVLKAITHGPAGEQIDDYTSWPWPTLCAAMSCLRVQRRTGIVVALPSVHNLVHSPAEKTTPAPVSKGGRSGVDGTRTRRKIG